MNHLIIVSGPTASGKTEVAIALAQHFQTEVLSADARQFYREMTIGTAKPSPEQLTSVPHHFINSFSIRDTYSAGQFEQDALQCLKKIYADHNTVVMVGGSGLYIKAVCEGLDTYPEVPSSVRESLNRLYEAQGITALQQKLQALDPDYYAVMDRANPQRLTRALEVCIASGKPFSAFRQKAPTPRDFNNIKIGLELDREELYQRINRRVDTMMAAGLLEEARILFPEREWNALQTVGYQELFDHFEEKHNLETAVELIKRNTRRYAKRQLTWFRKDPDIRWFRPEEKADMIAYIQAKIA